jgi:hypothetical protein
MATLEEKTKTVVDFSGVTEEVAKDALQRHGEDILLALVELSITPHISGTKYIPPPPVVNDGHHAETKERIEKGRIMADILSASPRNDLRGTASHYPQEPATERLPAVPEAEQPHSE